MSTSPSSTSQVPRAICDLSTPLPIVALPCGSMSMSNTRRRVAASDAARLTAVVVLPTPPFWFAMAMTRFIGRQCTALSRRSELSSGDQFLRTKRGPTQPLARDLVGHGTRRTVLATGALEDLCETSGYGMDISDDLRLRGGSLVLVPHADYAPGVDDVVGGVKDPGRLQRRSILGLRQLVIGRTGDDARSQARNRLRIEHGAERTGGQHVDFEGKNLVRSHGARPEFPDRAADDLRSHIGDRQPHALRCEQLAEVIADAAEALHRDSHALEV